MGSMKCLAEMCFVRNKKCAEAIGIGGNTNSFAKFQLVCSSANSAKNEHTIAETKSLSLPPNIREHLF